MKSILWRTEPKTWFYTQNKYINHFIIEIIRDVELRSSLLPKHANISKTNRKPKKRNATLDNWMTNDSPLKQEEEKIVVVNGCICWLTNWMCAHFDFHAHWIWKHTVPFRRPNMWLGEASLNDSQSSATELSKIVVFFSSLDKSNWKTQVARRLTNGCCVFGFIIWDHCWRLRNPLIIQ